MRFIVPVVVACLFTLPALADPEKGHGEMSERVHQKMQVWLTTELSTRLGLDEKKTIKLSQTVKAQMEKRKEHHQKLKEEARKLQGLVDSKSSDADIKKQLDVVASQAGHGADLRDLLSETGGYLTVSEQAKLALALPEIMKEMHHMMREGRGKMKEHRGGGFFGDDGDAGDED